MLDYNILIYDQDKLIEDLVFKIQVDILVKNVKDFGLVYFGMMDKRNGIIYVVGLERGLILLGMIIVCGDLYIFIYGVMGVVVFGIGISEVEMVLVL